MTGLASDIDATFDLIESRVEELRTTEPKHELLLFAGPVLETEEWAPVVRADYIAKFAQEKGTMVLQAMVNYLIALEVALGKREVKSDKYQMIETILDLPIVRMMEANERHILSKMLEDKSLEELRQKIDELSYP